MDFKSYSCGESYVRSDLQNASQAANLHLNEQVTFSKTRLLLARII